VKLGGAASGGTDEADGVRVVDHDDRVVSVGEVADLSQPGEVTIHREHPVGGDEPAPCAFALGQARFELVHIAVGVAQPLGLAEADTVDDRRVVERVGDHGVLGTEQRLEQAAVGVEARVIEDRVLGAQELAQAILQALVDLLRAANKPHRRQPIAPFVKRSMGGGKDLRVVGQAKVIVGAEVEHLAVRYTHVRGLR